MKTKENEHKVFPFICTGESFESEQEAWERFDENLADMFYWVRGCKYWRVIPTFEKIQDFDSLEVIYRVYSRIISTKDVIKGWKQINLGYPYDDAESCFEKDTFITVGELPEF